MQFLRWYEDTERIFSNIGYDAYIFFLSTCYGMLCYFGADHHTFEAGLAYADYWIKYYELLIYSCCTDVKETNKVFILLLKKTNFICKM